MLVGRAGGRRWVNVNADWYYCRCCRYLLTGSFIGVLTHLLPMLPLSFNGQLYRRADALIADAALIF
jgi:hypothetical protein